MKLKQAGTSIPLRMHFLKNFLLSAKPKSYLLVVILFSCLICKAQQTSTTTYETENLKIERLTANTFIHTSYLNTETYGKVSCNGMVVIDQKEAIVIDTPTDDTASAELLMWIETHSRSTVIAVVATHFHVDCLGGLNEFHKRNIPSYASKFTVELAKSADVIAPLNGFAKTQELKVGNNLLINDFLGEGHTKDNIISYFPSEKVLFGGCLVKAEGAGKGNLNDANVDEWSNTVQNVETNYGQAEFIIPGHGQVGDVNLLDYTIELFKK